MVDLRVRNADHTLISGMKTGKEMKREKEEVNDAL